MMEEPRDAQSINYAGPGTYPYRNSGVVRPKPGFNCPRNGGRVYSSNRPARMEIPDKEGAKWRKFGLGLHPTQ